MGKKKIKNISNNSFYEDEKGISAGGVPVISKRKKRKQIENEKSITLNPKILILCEGQTEVNYFKGITKSQTYKYKMGAVYTTVVAMPENNQAKNLLLLAVRILLNTTKNNKINTELIEILNSFFEKNLPENEQKRKEQINYYQAKCNALLEDNTPFDQIWLIFDNDDNNEEKQSVFSYLFTKAKDFNIDIAYSNRQFENWILLHFEQNQHIFLASECKNCLEGSKQIKCKYSDDCRCGLSDFSKNKKCVGIDCKGTICIGGYLRENKLHTSYKKGDWRKESGGNDIATHEYCYKGLFDTSVKDFLNVTQAQEKVVFDKIRTAIQNAEWLRNQQGNPKPEIATNPYTDVDKLVQVLIGV
jgi:hypothetical protein